MLRYGDLSVSDAAGKRLPARLELAGKTVRIAISDKGARYPITVDPLIQPGTRLAPGVGDVETNALFGYSVALSTDGNTALVGAYADEHGAGAAWVFTKSGGVWTQDGPKLQPADEVNSSVGGSGGEFGLSVALSADGTTALIGGEADNGGVGAAWVFVLSNGFWIQQATKLVPNDEDNSTISGQFGHAVALSSDGNTALIGGESDSGSKGAAWVFTRSGDTWTQQGPKLTGVSVGNLGASVALSADGNTALVGAPSGAGGAYAFTRTGSSWTRESPELTGGSAFSEFGFSVALSADGETALIGGPNEGTSGAGGAWVFTQSGGSWAEQGPKLIPNDENPNNGGTFGYSVAISSDGNTALIGGGSDNNGAGAAWVFTRSSSVWAQHGSKLRPSDENSTIDPGFFGESVALSGSGADALIGGYQDDGDRGAVWVFDESGAAWAQNGSKLVGLDSDQAGFSVAVSTDGNTALVGGPFASGGGRVWLFAHSGATWNLQQSFSTCEQTDGYGYSVALSADGNTALVGCPTGDNFMGTAWAFTRSGSIWSFQGELGGGSDEDTTGGGSQFGASVALSADGNTALIGGPFDGGNFAGAAWVWTRSGGAWTQQGSKLTGNGEDNTGGGGLFGASVALTPDGNTALIGAPGDGGDEAGAAWVFTRTGSTWSRQGGKLTGSGEDNSGGGGGFGESVALSQVGTALIGAPYDGTENTGAAWAFARSGSAWSQQGGKLTPSDEDNTGGGGWFGFGLSLSNDGNTALIGAPLDGGDSAGAVWIFARSSSSWVQQGTKTVASGNDASFDGQDFGWSIAQSLTTTLIGAPGDGSYSAGAAWAYASSIPGRPTGVTAVPGNGNATVSFTPPAVDGGLGITAYTVSASPGGASDASPTPGPIEVAGLTNGVTYTFTVTATNALGTGQASVVSNAVTPSATSSGGGGNSGGGGGGGGGGAPNLHVAVSSSPTPQKVGDQFDYSITVTNTGGASNGSTLNVNLPPQVSYQGFHVDRGPGCSASGQTISCNLDFFPPGQVSTVQIGGQVAALGTATLTTSTYSSPLEYNPADSAITYTLTIGSNNTGPIPATPQLPPAPHPGTSPAAVAVTGLSPVVLDATKPTVRFVVDVSKNTTLTTKLLGKSGKLVATWHTKVEKGSSRLSLLLPIGAREPGRDTLEVIAAGGNADKSWTVTLVRSGPARTSSSSSVQCAPSSATLVCREVGAVVSTLSPASTGCDALGCMLKGGLPGAQRLIAKDTGVLAKIKALPLQTSLGRHARTLADAYLNSVIELEQTEIQGVQAEVIVLECKRGTVTGGCAAAKSTVSHQQDVLVLDTTRWLTSTLAVSSFVNTIYKKALATAP